eukprot:155706-Prymnesium_polylepis.2
MGTDDEDERLLMVVGDGACTAAGTRTRTPLPPINLMPPLVHTARDGPTLTAANFGERALLKSQVRFAGVRADTKLKCMCISRAGFEEILGPLHLLVPDKY